MKKYLFLLLAFAVAGATMSCEKEPNNNGFDDNDPNNEIKIPDNDDDDDKADEIEKLIGCWVCDIAEEPDDKEISTYRFYGEGKGYITTDNYNIHGTIGGYTRGAMTYWIEGEKLLILGVHAEKPRELFFNLDGDKLTLTSCIDPNIVYTYTKTEDASKKFMGSWQRWEKIGDYYYQYIITMTTPTDGYTMYMKYLSPTSGAIEKSMSEWFKYKFDDIQIKMSKISHYPVSTESPMYYRMEGNNLYLRNSYHGEEICYEDFYRANGIEFRP